MKRHYILWPIVSTILIVIILIILLLSYYQNWQSESISIENDVAKLVRSDEDQTDTDFKTIIHEAQKSVVQIEAESDVGQSIGSGFIFNDKGDIITNAHVVANAHSVYVKTANARTFPAAVIGISSSDDVAVLRVPQLVDRGTLPIDPDFDIEIGDEIIAVGSPLGFQNTVTLGNISGLNRNFSVDGFDYKGVYQISAPITKGNSGGPLIHSQSGYIIAINSAGSNEGQIGFSIPIHNVYDLVQMRSDQADEEELTYDGDYSTFQNVDEEKLLQDANYIVNYSYENLEMRDYLNAYKLLGSEWQKQTSYQDFRKDFIHIIDLSISNVESELLSNDQVKITLNANMKSKTETQRITDHYEISFIIGYENDQLKLLEQNKSLLSVTEEEIIPPIES